MNEIRCEDGIKAIERLERHKTHSRDSEQKDILSRLAANLPRVPGTSYEEIFARSGIQTQQSMEAFMMQSQ